MSHRFVVLDNARVAECKRHPDVATDEWAVRKDKVKKIDRRIRTLAAKLVSAFEQDPIHPATVMRLKENLQTRLGAVLKAEKRAAGQKRKVTRWRTSYYLARIAVGQSEAAAGCTSYTSESVSSTSSDSESS